MKPLEMLDTNMLMLMGLMDHPIVIKMEQDRLAYEKKRKNIEEMVDRLMNIDENLDDLLLAVAVMHSKEGEKA